MGIPQALMAMLNGERCIAVGDHRQLPPVAQHEPRFAPSIFDQLIAAYADTAVMLDKSFRMNAEICASPSRLFYHGHLHSAPQAASRRLTLTEAVPPPANPAWLATCLDPERPVVFVAVSTDTGTDVNLPEADVVGQITAHWLARGLGSVEEGLAVV